MNNTEYYNQLYFTPEQLPAFYNYIALREAYKEFRLNSPDPTAEGFLHFLLKAIAPPPCKQIISDDILNKIAYEVNNAIDKKTATRKSGKPWDY